MGYCSTTNSSPPKRATTSEPRTALRSRSATDAQELVAAGMAQRIVDLLELVEVDEMDRERPAPAQARHRRVHLVAEQGAVGQAGERIVARQLVDLGLGHAAVGDVLEQHDGAAVRHRVERQRERATVLGLEEDLAARPIPQAASRAPPAAARRARGQSAPLPTQAADELARGRPARRRSPAARPAAPPRRLLQTATRRSASNMHSPCGILLSAVSNRPASRLMSRLATTASSRTRRRRSEMNFSVAKKGTSTKAKIRVIRPADREKRKRHGNAGADDLGGHQEIAGEVSPGNADHVGERHARS